jgi:thioester reductase-like protein
MIIIIKYYYKENQKDFHQLLKENANLYGNEVCFDFFDYSLGEKKNITITREELFKKSCEIAKLIKKNGGKRGDNILIFSTQTADNVLSAIASIFLGTVFTIIPPPVDSNKMLRFLSVLESCKPKFLLCTSEVNKKLVEVFKNVKQNDKYKDLISNLKIIPIDQADKVYGEFTPEKISFEDIIYLQYSSGSTSAPKGVEITYGNLISNLNLCLEGYDIKRVFSWVPFFHNIGLVYMMFASAIKTGLSAGIMSPAAFLERPARWIEGVSEFKADVTIAPNSAVESYSRLVPPKTLKNIDLSNLKSVHTGAEIVTYSALKKFSDAFEPFGFNMNKFVTGYGLAEATCAMATSFVTKESILNIDFDEYQKGKMVIVDEDYPNKIQFISGGEILDHTNIKIVNPETKKECSEDEFGEIWLQGVIVANGYYKNVAGTEETFKEKLEGYQGEFLRTGDLGIVKDGHVFVTGRVKELIIINGNNIMPNDIVSKVKELDSILEHVLVVPFSTFDQGKEKLVLVLDIPEKLYQKIDISKLSDDISACIYEYFEVSPYDISVINHGTLPKADNGKVSLLSTRQAYIDGRLDLVYSKNDSSKEQQTQSADDKLETEAEEKLFKIINERLSFKANKNDNLLNIGMDSLAIVELATIIDNEFSVNIPVGLIFEKPTIKFLAEYIDKAVRGEALYDLAADKSYLYDECKLDNNISFGAYNDTNPKMQNVLVTGTTGFVGAYLIYNLLNQSSATIYCHVRAKSEEHGFDRIKENMEYYKLWKEEYRERIIPILGSVDKPNLGIEANLYQELTKIIDTVFHNGAVLNFIYPYNRLKDTNVNGTVETIRFAGTNRSKYFNYVSSYSVFDNPSYFNKTIVEDDKLEDCQGYFLAYSETKWVSEKIISIARERGLKAAIFRPGEITGATDTGIWKYSDSVSRTIKNILDSKVYGNIDLKLHMTQVDYIAAAIVAIAKKGSSYGKAFNLINQVPIPLNRLGEMIQECGYDVAPVEYEKWRENLFNSGNEHPLKLLESLFRSCRKPGEDIASRYGEKEAILETSNTENALKGTGIICEPMNVELIKKYIKNFI